MENVNYIPHLAAKPKELRSRVTNGKTLFAKGGDNRGAWARRYRDLYQLHLSDLGGAEACSEAELALCDVVATTRVEMGQLAARMSEGNATMEDIDAYNRLSGNLRRLLETLGLERRQPPSMTARHSLARAWAQVMSLHRITYRPELRAHGLGPTPLEYDGKSRRLLMGRRLCGRRWLLTTGHAEPEDRLETSGKASAWPPAALGCLLRLPGRQPCMARRNPVHPAPGLCHGILRPRADIARGGMIKLISAREAFEAPNGSAPLSAQRPSRLCVRWQ